MGTFRDRGEQVGGPERANHSVLNWKVTCARPVTLVVRIDRLSPLKLVSPGVEKMLRRGPAGRHSSYLEG
jgi:hypothetical protein